jgi:hypothetical protein
LHGGVHDRAFQVGGLDGFDLDGRLNDGFEQLLQAFLAKRTPKAADLGGVAGQAGLVVGHAAEVLPAHANLRTDGSNAARVLRR